MHERTNETDQEMTMSDTMTADCNAAAIARIARARDAGAVLAFVPEDKAVRRSRDGIARVWDAAGIPEVAVAVLGEDVVRIYADGYAERLAAA